MSASKFSQMRDRVPNVLAQGGIDVWVVSFSGGYSFVLTRGGAFVLYLCALQSSIHAHACLHELKCVSQILSDRRRATRHVCYCFAKLGHACFGFVSAVHLRSLWSRGVSSVLFDLGRLLMWKTTRKLLQPGPMIWWLGPQALLRPPSLCLSLFTEELSTKFQAGTDISPRVQCRCAVAGVCSVKIMCCAPQITGMTDCIREIPEFRLGTRSGLKLSWTQDLMLLTCAYPWVKKVFSASSC